VEPGLDLSHRCEPTRSRLEVQRGPWSERWPTGEPRRVERTRPRHDLVAVELPVTIAIVGEGICPVPATLDDDTGESVCVRVGALLGQGEIVDVCARR